MPGSVPEYVRPQVRASTHIRKRTYSDTMGAKLKTFGKFTGPAPDRGLRLPEDMTATHPQNRRLR
jgi:hypothetical protein